MALNQDDGKHVVRVDQDSETDLQALFDLVLKPDSKRPLQVPWSMRKLPDSFFNPPSTGSKSINHSRENSVDSAFGSAGSGASSTTATSGTVNAVPLQTTHLRAHSSPASLQQTYAVGQTQPPPAPHHIKQRSYDVAIKVEDNAPLPAGWEQARTPEGQLYYLKWVIGLLLPFYSGPNRISLPQTRPVFDFIVLFRELSQKQNRSSLIYP